ncbi:MAG: amidase family protein [Caldilinea sp.]|nr:amidase family protein [Caldilinea sp.]
MLFQRARLGETAAALREGALDLHVYVEAVCDRIEAVDGLVQAFLPEAERRRRLHSAADDLLATFPVPAERPVLFGVAAGIKDIFHVKEFLTRAGSTLPPERLAGPEAVSVRRLRDAGGLVAGKTVTTEFAYFEPGPTANGLVYFSRTVDQVGLFTQDVAGMALAASALCDDWEEVTLSADDLPVLGVADGPYLRQAAPEALALFRRQLARLEAEGYTLWHVPTLLDIEALNRWHRRLVFAEFAREHAQLYAEFGERYRPRTAEIVRAGQQVSDGELADLRGACLGLRDSLEKQMQQAGIDLWVAPAALGPAPAGLQATGDPNMNLPWTTAGFPALTVPAGAVRGLPVGLQLVARFSDDELLLAWAEEIAKIVA